jgi:hypothetical protein
VGSFADWLLGSQKDRQGSAKSFWFIRHPHPFTGFIFGGHHQPLVPASCSWSLELLTDLYQSTSSVNPVRCIEPGWTRRSVLDKILTYLS